MDLPGKTSFYLFFTILIKLNRINHQERSLQLLEEAYQDKDLLPLHILHFETLYQAILNLEDHEMLHRMLRLCPDLYSEDPLVRSKSQLRRRVSGVNALGSLRIHPKKRDMLEAQFTPSQKT